LLLSRLKIPVKFLAGIFSISLGDNRLPAPLNDSPFVLFMGGVARINACPLGCSGSHRDAPIADRPSFYHLAKTDLTEPSPVESDGGEVVGRDPRKAPSENSGEIS
jgi:hypothetical protein